MTNSPVPGSSTVARRGCCTPSFTGSMCVSDDTAPGRFCFRQLHGNTSHTRSTHLHTLIVDPTINIPCTTQLYSRIFVFHPHVPLFFANGFYTEGIYAIANAIGRTWITCMVARPVSKFLLNGVCRLAKK